MLLHNSDIQIFRQQDSDDPDIVLVKRPPTPGWFTPLHTILAILHCLYLGRRMYSEYYFSVLCACALSAVLSPR